MLPMLKSARRDAFAYTPPMSIYGVNRVLVTAGAANPRILAEVLRGLWRFSPHTNIVVAENEALEPKMLCANMQTFKMDSLPPSRYPLQMTGVETDVKIAASSFLAQVNGCISVVSLRNGDLSQPPTLDHLSSLTEDHVNPLEAYFSIGSHFVGAVVDTGEKVYWGDDLLEVDEAAYRALGQPLPIMLREIREKRK
jgi:hypothetical protein